MRQRHCGRRETLRNPCGVWIPRLRFASRGMTEWDRLVGSRRCEPQHCTVVWWDASVSSSFPRNSRLRGNDRESSYLRKRRQRHGHGNAGVPPAHEKGRHTQENVFARSEATKQSRLLRHSREIPAYAGMTGNPVCTGNAIPSRQPHSPLTTCHSSLLYSFFRPSGVCLFFARPKKVTKKRAPA